MYQKLFIFVKFFIYDNFSKTHMVRQLFDQLFSQANLFIANNLFDKKVILFNKKKLCPFTNVKLDKFFREIIVINVTLL